MEVVNAGFVKKVSARWRWRNDRIARKAASEGKIAEGISASSKVSGGEKIGRTKGRKKEGCSKRPKCCAGGGREKKGRKRREFLKNACRINGKVKIGGVLGGITAARGEIYKRGGHLRGA